MKLVGVYMSKIIQFSDSVSAQKSIDQGGTIEVLRGDTIVVESEGIVAVAYTYPFAVTANKGDFCEFTWDEPISNPATLLEIVKNIQVAVAEAVRLGIKVNPAFMVYAASSGAGKE